MNKQMQFSSIVICLLVLTLVNNGSAQGCCGIGGSLVSGGHPVLDKNTFLLNTSGNYADADNPDRYRTSGAVMLAYGVTDRLSLSLKTSYIWAGYSIYFPPIIVNGEQLFAGETVNYRNSGFGDGYASVQYALIKLTPMNKQELIAGIDAGIPWGYSNKINDGKALPQSVQTGTGGYSLNGFLTYLKAFPLHHYSVAATIAGRVAFRARRNNDFIDELSISGKGRDPGDEFSVMVTSLFGPFFATRESISFTYHQTGMTYNAYDKPETSSSGKRLSLVPALEYSIKSDLKLSINADIPLWRDRNQTLLGNDKVLRAEIFWFIHKTDNIHQLPKSG